tara:strand:- start:283 stop:1254 length:972 start_codon:yes stop_codon:yes gene_type:complete
MLNPNPSSTVPLAQQLKAAADPLRLDILRAMACGSFGVLELCRLFGIKQSGMSHHLKVLAAAGWISSRREGNSIFYRRAHLSTDNYQAPLQQQLFDTLDAQLLSDPVQDGIKVIQAERSAQSLRFFSDNADKFREQQDLIASYPVYADQVLELLTATLLPQRQSVLEVGPGVGEFLTPLAAQFEQVIALDNSSAMLERAQATASKLANIEFIAGDTTTLSKRNITADCIVVNMVLHHTPNPRQVFSELSTALNCGGALLITDLCRHDQSWVRETCGDLWQGFEPSDFSSWASDAGLREGQAVYFALRNGFQIQLRQFFKHKQH